jgi:predicted RNase H-like nuclease
MAVLGVDACRTGWIGVVLADTGAPIRAVQGRHIADLVADAGSVDVVGIDIPVGLAISGRRQADELVRAMLGARWQSLFMTPVRAALLMPGPAEANTRNRELTGYGVSRQAFALAGRILQVDEWLADCRIPVVEVHPELCFATMAGAPLADSKKTWAGMVARRALLARQGIAVPDELGRPGALAATDDVLDAAAVAWTARRVAGGIARSYPDPPERFEDGSSAAIWV